MADNTPNRHNRPWELEATTAAAAAAPPAALQDTTTIAGGYAVTITSGYIITAVLEGTKLNLAIAAAADAPGVYEADFDFWVLKGAMLLSADEKLLDRHVASFESDEESEDEEGEDEEGEGEEQAATDTAGGKRKADAAAADARPSKKAKTAAPEPSLKFHVRLRSCETGTGEIQYFPSDGEIWFTDESYTKFNGDIHLGPFMGKATLTGEKVKEAASVERRWTDYSLAVYEEDQAAR